MAGLPDRIWIVGVTGSGKSTLAATLAVRMGVEAVHMDELHWLPEWQERDPEETAALLTELGWSAVPVMGVSFGGMVAQELALRYPQLVSRLVLACTSSGGAGGASYPLHELETLPADERLVRHLELSDLRRTAQWRADNPERWQTLLNMAAAGARADRDLDGARRQLQARAGHDTYERLPQLRMPVLLVGGESDGIAPVANMKAMAAQISDARLQFFTGGHLFLIQDKTAYPYIIQWLSD